MVETPEFVETRRISHRDSKTAILSDLENFKFTQELVIEENNFFLLFITSRYHSKRSNDLFSIKYYA
jgi:hypothetical protein